MTKKLFLAPLVILFALSISVSAKDTDQSIMGPSPKAKGQEGNGGFVYKDKEREKKADVIMERGLDELTDVISKARDSIFSDLKPSVDRKEFLKILKNVTYQPYITTYRPLPNGAGLILMMDYNTDSLGTKYIVVYAPMFIALMYMEDENAAKKLFETELIHEILHFYSYDEDKADVTAPLIYSKLFPL